MYRNSQKDVKIKAFTYNTIKNIDIYSEMNDNYVVDKDKKITGYASIDKPWQKYYSKEAITASIPELTAYQYMVSQNQDKSKAKYILRKI